MKYLLCLIAAWLLGCVPVLAADFFSRQTGNWNNLATWSNMSHTGAAATTLPTATDNVIIGNMHVVTLTSNAAVNNLTINAGTLQYDNAAVRRFTIAGLLRIETNGEFTIQQVGAQRQNELILGGNVIVNGRWTMRPNPSTSAYCARVIFASPNLQTITGNPQTTILLYRASLNKNAKGNFVDCSVPIDISTGTEASTEAFYFNDTFYNFAGGVGGTWRQIANTLSLHQNSTNNRFQNIEPQGAIHIIGTANMLFGQSGGATFILQGGDILFNTMSAQPSRFGVNPGNSLEYDNNADISSFTLQQGTVIVAGRFAREGAAMGATDAIRYEQTGGTLIVGAIPNHTSANRGTFEAASALSTFSMSGGSIIIRNQNISASVNRPADFWLNAASTISGGTIHFGDAESSPNQVFSINIPATTPLNNLTIGSAARLHPFTPAQHLRLAGNMLVNGTFDGTQTHPSNAMPAASILTLQGNNANNQSISGTGTITLHNFTMNRQSVGNGVAQVLRGVQVRGVLNFAEMPAMLTIPQILELGSGTDLTITNNATNAIQNATENRHVRTSTSSGRLYRALSGTAEYLFPLGSFGSNVNMQATYTPLTYYAESASGQLGAKVFSGTNSVLQGAHRQVPSGVTSYARRTWSLATGGITGSGRVAAAIPLDIAGSPAAMRFARYRPDETTAGGTWLYTDTLQSRMGSEFDGDWTWLEAALRVFYSRSSGLWNDAASWSFVSHTGAAIPSGVFPSRMSDSVIIGGGVNGMNNHVITAQNPVTIGAVRLGTGQTNTGTLECPDETFIAGASFQLGERSTLRIGSAQGITGLSRLSGNIRTTGLRMFSQNAHYEYIGTANTDQEFGDGLPSEVYALSVSKPVLTRLLADRSINIWQNLSITSGIFDVQNFTFRNVTTGTAGGALTLGASGILRIGGTRGFADASTGTVSNYATYNLADRSTVEFYGSQHVIEPIPTNVAFGNISIRASAQVSLWNPVLLRGSLWVRDTARFLNFSRDMRVLGEVYNNASLLNYGVLDVGQ